MSDEHDHPRAAAPDRGRPAVGGPAEAEDLAVLGSVALILAGGVIRAGVFSPATVRGLLEDEDAGGS